jgi:hypothetical protein
MKQMKSKTTVPHRRRNYHWTRGELDRLIDWHLVGFLPDRDVKEEPKITEEVRGKALATLGGKLRDDFLKNLGLELKQFSCLELTKEGQQELLDALGKRLRDDSLRVLELELKQLRRRELTEQERREVPATLVEKLRSHFLKNLGAELNHLKRSKLQGDDLDGMLFQAAERVDPSRIGNLGVICQVYPYLRASLGLHPYPKRSPNLDQLRDPRWLLRRRLENTAQEECLLRWVDLSPAIWNSSAWRECLWMRYEGGDRKAITFLRRSWRRILDDEAERLRNEVGAENVSEKHFDKGARLVGLTEYVGAAHHTLRGEYLRARVNNDLGRKHALYTPISETGYFERVATSEAHRDALSAQNQTSYIDQFCRYLNVPQGHADELIGSVLYQFLRLQTEVREHPQNSPPEMAGIKWPSRLRPERVRISEDYRLLSARFAAALEIAPRVFEEIAQAYVALRLRQFWQQRANVTMIVFWCARILEGLHLDVYKVYGKWIDFFHVQMLRPLLQAVKKGEADGGYINAALGPASRALQSDPLLKCVFHSEVFGGRDRLFVASAGKREDEQVRSVITTYAVHRLRDARKETPQIRVSELLPDDLPIQHHVRAAAQITVRSTQIRGRGHYAYVAPLITALIDDPLDVLNADSVKDTFHNHERDPEVIQLRTDLPRIAAAATRG